MKNKHLPIIKTQESKEKLSEIGSMLYVSIQRLYSLERDKISKNSLDFHSKQSVNAPSSKYEE